MDFKNIPELNKYFTSGEFDMPKSITVKGIKFDFLKSTKFRFHKMLNGSERGGVVYTAHHTHHEKALEHKIKEWLVFFWGHKGSDLKPYRVINSTKARVSASAVFEGEGNVIGLTANVKLTNLPYSSAIKAKVDTGAEMSSLHADQYDIKNNQVSFVSKAISDKVLTMPLADKQAIKSADGGVEYRPVISLNIKVDDKQFTDVLFNLNNRSHMEHPMLLGKNVLAKGNYHIDPKQESADNELEIDWDALYEQLNEDDALYQKSEDLSRDESLEKTAKLVETLTNSGVTFECIMRYIRTEAANRVSKLK